MIKTGTRRFRWRVRTQPSGRSTEGVLTMALPQQEAVLLRLRMTGARTGLSLGGPAYELRIAL